jgi:hypothetical protein
VRQACPAGCCPHIASTSIEPPAGAEPAAAVSCPADVPEANPAERIVHLYACQGLSTYRIADLAGISRGRVTRVLHRSGVPVKPRGAGRRRPRRGGPRLPDETLAELYRRDGLTCAQISAVTGIPARTVRDRLVRGGVRMRSKGRGNREDRLTVDPERLTGLYLRAGMSAADAGAVLGVSRRIVLRAAHEEGLPSAWAASRQDAARKRSSSLTRSTPTRTCGGRWHGMACPSCPPAGRSGIGSRYRQRSARTWPGNCTSRAAWRQRTSSF